MLYFPNLDEKTRLIMQQELLLDEQRGLFYTPLSILSDYLPQYRRLLKATFAKGNIESLERALSNSTILRKTDKNGRKIPSNISKVLSFSDFNRYYVRAILVRAIEENKTVYIYRAKSSLNERSESNSKLQRNYFDKNTLKSFLHQIRDYRILFSKNTTVDFMQPNSGLSLRLG